MTCRIYIECGAAETRAACVIGGKPVRFWFAPARGDEHLPRPPMTGDLYLGRVRTVSKALNGAFIDIDHDREAFLPFRKGERAITEGSLIEVIVKRPAIGKKGAVLGLPEEQERPRGEPRDRHRPGALGEPVDAAINAFVCVIPAAGGGSEPVSIDDPAAASILRDYGLDSVTINHDLFESSGAEEGLAVSLEREFLLDGGARLTIDETEGVTVIDVDAGAMAGSETRRLNDNVNLAAAQALPAELSRRAIGGRAIVDFLPPSRASARDALLAALKSAGRGLFDARYGKMSPDGLVDITIPRTGYSLLEMASEPAAGAGWLRSGRRPTLDWRAKAAIRALERRLRTETSARLTLLAGAALASYIAIRPQWRERLAQRFGARFDIMADPKLEERAFDVAERR